MNWRHLLWSLSAMTTFVCAGVGAQQVMNWLGGNDLIMLGLAAVFALFSYLNKNSN